MSDVKRSAWESPPPSSLRLSSFYSLPVSDPCRIQLPIWASMRPVIYISGTLRPFQMGSESVSSPWLSGEAGSIILFKCSCFFREHSGSGGFLRGRNVNHSCLIRADHHAFLVRPPYINFHYRKWLFWIVTFFFFFLQKGPSATIPGTFPDELSPSFSHHYETKQGSFLWLTFQSIHCVFSPP